MPESPSLPRSRVSLALFFDAKHAVTHVDFDESKNQLLTSGYDRVIKVSSDAACSLMHVHD